jgi:DNA-directed RNA polymerase subunit M/transcription elongation factor TFIIS
MADGVIRVCPECKSTEVIVHERDVAAVGDTTPTLITSYECIECGRFWRPDAELTGQTRKPIGRYS